MGMHMGLLVYTQVHACMHAKLLQLCLILCNPMDCSPPAPPSMGVLQARILEWVARPSSRGPSPPRDQTWTPCIAGRFFFTTEPPGKPTQVDACIQTQMFTVHTYSHTCMGVHTHIHACVQTHTHIRACVQRLKSTVHVHYVHVHVRRTFAARAHTCTHTYSHIAVSSQTPLCQRSRPGPALLSPLATSSPLKNQTSPASGIWYAPAPLEERGDGAAKTPEGTTVFMKWVTESHGAMFLSQVQFLSGPASDRRLCQPQAGGGGAEGGLWPEEPQQWAGGREAAAETAMKPRSLLWALDRNASKRPHTACPHAVRGSGRG